MKLFSTVEWQRQKYHSVVEAVSNRHGDLEATKHLHAFYKSEAERTDPRKDWWGYAALRHKQEELEQDIVLYERRYKEAKAKLEAHKLKMEKSL